MTPVDARPVDGATLSPSQLAADRAAGNAAARATADIVAKLGALVLVFVLARRAGATGLGVYVFALAWAEVTRLPIVMGFDRFLTRQVAADRGNVDALLANVIAVKLVRTVPVLAASFLLVNALGYGGASREAVYAAAIAMVFDALTGTVVAVFTGLERGGLSAAVLLFERMLFAALGLLALALGRGVVSVLAAYVVSTACALGLALVLLVARVGRPRVVLTKAGWRTVQSRTLGFAVQEVFSTGIARADAVLLSLLGTTAAVGIYGAGYRLLEASLFVPIALTAAFAAMFTYLGSDSQPSVRAVYGYALKAAMTLLVPIAAVLIVLAGPVLRLFFGDGFGGAVAPLRLLAPAVVLLAIVMLSTSLVVSRRDPSVMVRAFAAALAINVAANLALIPLLGATGAALSMLITEAAFALMGFRMAAETVGRPALGHTFGTPLAAGAAMVVPMLLLRSVPLLAGVAGVVAYVGVLVAAELRFSPGDVRFAVEILRRRLPVVGA